MRLWDTVEFAHVSFCLVPEVFNSIDVVIAVSKELRMVNAKVMKVGHIQYIITAPAIRIDYAIGDDLAFYDRDQRRPRSVWDDLRVNLAAPF